MTKQAKFSDIIKGEEPVLVDFFATWCGPCQALQPVLQDLAAEFSGKVKIIKIDVDKNPIVASQYQVRGVPTLLLFRKGEMLWRQSGFLTAEQLRQVFSKELALN